MGQYHQLSLSERERMYAFKTAGFSLRAVARRLGRSPATICRELKRNAKYFRPYLPHRADNLAKKRGERQRYQAPLKCPFVFLYVRDKLRTTDWSPETIAGRLRLEHPEYSIDDETIYRYIYGKKGKRFKLWQHLLVRCPGHAIHSAYSIFITRVLELLHLDQSQVERRIDENYNPYRLQTTKND